MRVTFLGLILIRVTLLSLILNDSRATTPGMTRGVLRKKVEEEEEEEEEKVERERKGRSSGTVRRRTIPIIGVIPLVEKIYIYIYIYPYVCLT